MTSSLDLPVLARAVVAECHRLGGLNHRHVFLTVPEALKSKIKTLVDSVPSEGLLSGHLLTVSPYGRDRDMERAFWCLFLQTQ